MLNDLEFAKLLQNQYDGVPDFDYENRIGEVSFALKYYQDSTAIFFEGSHNIPDWFSNFKAYMVTVPRIGRIEQGFYEGMPETIDHIIGRIQRDKPIRIGGHSRGASHTNVAAAVLIDKGWKRENIIRTPIAPAMSGNADFVNFLKGSPGTAYRNWGNEFDQDFVCCAPGHFLLEPYEQVDPWTTADIEPRPNDPWMFLRRHHLFLYIEGMENGKFCPGR